MYINVFSFSTSIDVVISDGMAGKDIDDEEDGDEEEEEANEASCLEAPEMIAVIKSVFCVL